MFIKLLLLSAIFLTISAIGFGISMLLKSSGQFPETHISRNPEMKKRGISCARQTDTGCHTTEGFPGCAGCSDDKL
jgi:hypothetical protein